MADDPQLPNYDRFRFILEDFRFRREPWFEFAKLTHDNCVTFAQMSLKAGMILNGGALVVMQIVPTILGDIKPIRDFLVIGFFIFVLGLALSWLGTILGYFAVVTANTAHASRTFEFDINLTDAMNGNFVKYEEDLKEGHKVFIKAEKKYVVYRFIGIIFLLGSVICFVAGATECGYACGKLIGLWNSAELSHEGNPPFIDHTFAKN